MTKKKPPDPRGRGHQPTRGSPEWAKAWHDVDRYAYRINRIRERLSMGEWVRGNDGLLVQMILMQNVDQHREQRLGKSRRPSGRRRIEETQHILTKVLNLLPAGKLRKGVRKAVILDVLGTADSKVYNRIARQLTRAKKDKR